MKIKALNGVFFILLNLLRIVNSAKSAVFSSQQFFAVSAGNVTCWNDSTDEITCGNG